jgi:hypothetical protein
MTDFFAVSTKNDIDSISIDIDVIGCFNADSFLIEPSIDRKTGEETPRSRFPSQESIK